MERSEEEQVANTLEAKPIGGLVSDGLMNEIVPGLHHHHHHHHLHALHDHTSYVHHMGTPAGSAGSGGGNEGGRGSVSKSDLGVAADEKLTPLLGRSGTGEIENQERWGVVETRVFLQIYVDMLADFRTTKRNRLVWERLASRLTGKGFKRSFEQCRNRWKVLSKSYRAAKESLQAGHGRRNFEFFGEMDDLFKANPQMRAVLEGGDGGASDGLSPATPSTMHHIQQQQQQQQQQQAGSPGVNGLRFDDDDDAGDALSRSGRKRSFDDGGVMPETPSSSGGQGGGGKMMRLGSAGSGDEPLPRNVHELLLEVRQALAERKEAEAELKATLADMFEVSKQLLSILKTAKE